MNFLKKLSVKDFVQVCLLAALTLILTRVFKIETGIVRITFSFIPTTICAVLYGPFVTAFMLVVCDLIGVFLSGQVLHLGFTISALISGLIYGYILYNKKRSWVTISLVHIIHGLVISILLNTYWLSNLQGTPILALLPLRFIKEVVFIAVKIPTTYFCFMYITERLGYQYKS